jgi:hypothetical protein
LISDCRCRVSCQTSLLPPLRTLRTLRRASRYLRMTACVPTVLLVVSVVCSRTYPKIKKGFCATVLCSQ